MTKTKTNELDKENVRRAIIALKTYIKKKNIDNKKSLLDLVDYIYLQLSLKKIPLKGSIKPILIDIPHSLRSEGVPQLCMFIKDGDKERIKKIFQDKPLQNATIKLITLKKLKTDFKQFIHRRELVAAYDIFIADNTIIHFLLKALGNIFIKRKKQPIMVDARRPSTFINSINHIINNTWTTIPSGPIMAVKIAHLNMTIDQIVDNIIQGAINTIEKIPGKRKNILEIQITSLQCLTLPIFTSQYNKSILSNDKEKNDNQEPESETNE